MPNGLWEFSTDSMAIKWRDIGGTFLRLAVSAGLIFWVLQYVEIHRSVGYLRAADWQYLFLAVIAFATSFLFFSLRWRALLSAYGYHGIPLQRLLRIYWTGLFFNNFLPTSVGGDVVRAYYVSHIIRKKGESFASIFAERLLGFIVTSVISLVAVLFIAELFSNKALAYLISFLFLFTLFLLALLLHSRFFTMLTIWFERIKWFGFGAKFAQIFAAFKRFREHPRAISVAFVHSLLGQFFIILFNVFLYAALSGEWSFLPFLVVVPLTMVASLFPSINGLGTRESAYVFLLAYFAIPGEISLALAVMVFILPLILSLGGGIFYIINRIPLRSVQWENGERA
jgi:uncharacterized protein (TIRG00374 family)